MSRRGARAAIAVAALIAASVHARAGDGFRDEARDWTVTLPPGWEARPYAEVSDANRALQVAAARHGLMFVAKFAQHGPRTSSGPFVSVQWWPRSLDGVPWDQLVQEFANESHHRHEMDAATWVALGFESGFENDLPAVERSDPPRSTVHQTLDAPETRWTGRTVSFFGRHGVLRFHFLAVESEFDTHRAAFDGFSDGFRFDSDVAYEEPRSWTWWIDGVRWRRIAGAVVCGLLLGLVISTYRPKRVPGAKGPDRPV